MSTSRPDRSRPRARRTAALLAALCATIFLAPSLAAPQAAGQQAGALTGRSRLVERADFSRYVDGKYVGHAWREARGWLEPAGDGAIRGEYLVLEETLRDLRLAAAAVDRAGSLYLPAVAAAAGTAAAAADPGFPAYRGLPTLPAEGSIPGQSWTAPGSFFIDARGEGRPVRVPILVEYRDEGDSRLGEIATRKYWARFALRYRGLPKDEVTSITGSHLLEIQLDAETASPLLMRDSFDETVTWGTGGTERRKGFLLCFYEGGPAPDRGSVAVAMCDALGGTKQPGALASGAGGASPVVAASGGSMPAGAAAPALPASPGSTSSIPDTSIPIAGGDLRSAGTGPLLSGNGDLAAAGLELDESPLGLVLRAADLRFKPDSDEFLPAEKSRLDAIAAALRAALVASPGGSFLVEGHAAATGKPAGELELSGRRAKRAVDELVARGLAPALFVWRGLGSTIPLAPNDTEAGKARNRRVEITILD